MSDPYELNPSIYSTHHIVSELLGKNRRILDVGCNEGYLSELADKSNCFFGLDHSHEAISKAAKVYEDARCYDLNSCDLLPWDFKFDVVVMSEVLEHLVHPLNTLRFIISNYLKADGIAVVSLPNIANWRIRLALARGKFEYSDSGILDKTHLHFFTYASGRKLLEAAGLEIQSKFGGSTYFGPVIKILPFTQTLLATSMIFKCSKARLMD